jgi:ribonuclease HI
MSISKLTIYTDGGARGNPGPAGIGVYALDESGQTVIEYGEYLGERTNNQAEYTALVVALTKAKELDVSEVDCYLDSELVVKQLKREYKVKDANLAPLFLQVYNLSQAFRKVTFTHVRREQNKEADRLVNQAIDDYLRGRG